MINVPQEIIDEYLSDSVNKELIIKHDGIDPDTINYYTGDITDTNIDTWVTTFNAGSDGETFQLSNISPSNTNFLTYSHAPLINDWNYLNVSFHFQITSVSDASLLGDNIRFTVYIGSVSVQGGWVTYKPKATVISGTDVLISMSRSNIASDYDSATVIWIKVGFIPFGETAAEDFEVACECSKISMNYTRTATSAPGPWAEHPDFDKVPSLNPYTINNEALLYESFSLTESLCSQDNLKFGLCEAAHIEFDTVEPKLTVGDEVKPIIGLKDREKLTDNDLFAINWIASTGGGTQRSIGDEDFASWIQVLNPTIDDYYADWSDYIDELNLGSPMRVYEQWIIELAFDNVVNKKPTYFKYGYGAYFGNTRVWYVSNGFYNVSDYDGISRAISTYTNIYQNAYGVMSGVKDVWLRFYDEDHNVITSGTLSADVSISMGDIQYRIGLPGHTMPAYSEDDLYYADGTLDEYIDSRIFTDDIPLGVFYVSDIQKEYKHNFIKRKVTAYDRLVVLEQNAADWYTRYMYGIDFDSYTGNGFQFARQIFSTYLNYTHSVGLEACDYTDNEIDLISDNPHEEIRFNASPIMRMLYWKYTNYYASDIDPTKLYKVVITYRSDASPDNIPYYYDSFDPLGRGICGIGDVLVEETLSGGGTNRFLCNNGDYFVLSDDCEDLTIYVPCEWGQQSGGNWSHYPLYVGAIKVYKTEENKPRLVNDSVRLCYYNYGTKEIFACDSSITGRDVVRSLLEVCGCFYRLSRKDGLPEFVYPQKGGLYPSNTLFPADDLYPRQGMNEILASGKYMSLIAEDYEVKDFGRIQILKNIKSSDTVSVVEWQYEGNARGENTYIIDDNIFYCNDDMEYDYDGMPEVTQMLAGMWNVISNLGYVPNETKALGAPWLECGDRIGLLTYDGGFETFIFRRTLTGIQNLRDTYESYGDELNDQINNYGYSI